MKNQAMDTQEHNGYTNYDTWAVILELDNNRKNYFRLKNSASEYLKLNDQKLVIMIHNNFIIETKINWNNVSVIDIRKFLNEFMEEEGYTK